MTSYMYIVVHHYAGHSKQRIKSSRLLSKMNYNWQQTSFQGRCQVPADFSGVQSSPRVRSRELIRHNSRVRFSCSRRKQLVGAKEVACDDGSWSSVFPTCKGQFYVIHLWEGGRDGLVLYFSVLFSCGGFLLIVTIEHTLNCCSSMSRSRSNLQWHKSGLSVWC